MRIKKGDEVIVIAGKYKGVKGKVLGTQASKSWVIVQGVNRHKWHVKPKEGQPGHIVDHEAPIHISNIALIDPKTKKPTKIGYKMESGHKVRVAKKSGTVIN